MTAATSHKELVNFRIAAGLRGRLAAYAKLSGRSQTYVAEEALSAYLAWRAPQLKDLKKAVAAAEKQAFASQKSVDAIFAKYV